MVATIAGPRLGSRNNSRVAAKCLIRRAAGFDVPDFMASGPREILVPASGAQAARDILVDSGLRAAAGPPAATARRTRLIAGLLLAIAFVAVVLFMATHTWD